MPLTGVAMPYWVIWNRTQQWYDMEPKVVDLKLVRSRKCTIPPLLGGKCTYLGHVFQDVLLFKQC